MNVLPPLAYPLAPPPPPDIINGMPKDSIIRDTRTAEQLAGASFLGFCRAKVCSEFRTALVSGNAHHQAQFWCADLLCSGAIIDICDSLISVASRHTVSLNPRLVIYLDTQIARLFDIIQNSKHTTERESVDIEQLNNMLYVSSKRRPTTTITDSNKKPKPPSKTTEIRQKYLAFRNNKQVRELLAEMVYVVFSSRKSSGQDTIDICGTDEFDNGNMTSRLCATSTEYGDVVLKRADADEMRIAVNEFSYQLSLSQLVPKYNTLSAVYWIEWTLELERRSKLTKTGIECFARTHYAVDSKYRTMPIWILWDVVRHYAASKANGMAEKVCSAIANLFCFQFSGAASRLKKTRHLLYYAVRLFTEPVEFNAPLLITNSTNSIPPEVVESIHATYTQISLRLL